MLLMDVLFLNGKIIMINGYSLLILFSDVIYTFEKLIKKCVYFHSYYHILHDDGTMSMVHTTNKDDSRRTKTNLTNVKDIDAIDSALFIIFNDDNLIIRRDYENFPNYYSANPYNYKSNVKSIHVFMNDAYILYKNDDVYQFMAETNGQCICINNNICNIVVVPTCAILGIKHDRDVIIFDRCTNRFDPYLIRGIINNNIVNNENNKILTMGIVSMYHNTFTHVGIITGAGINYHVCNVKKMVKFNHIILMLLFNKTIYITQNSDEMKKSLDILKTLTDVEDIFSDDECIVTIHSDFSIKHISDGEIENIPTSPTFVLF